MRFLIWLIMDCAYSDFFKKSELMQRMCNLHNSEFRERLYGCRVIAVLQYHAVSARLWHHKIYSYIAVLVTAQ